MEWHRIEPWRCYCHILVEVFQIFQAFIGSGFVLLVPYCLQKIKSVIRFRIHSGALTNQEYAIVRGLFSVRMACTLHGVFSISGYRLKESATGLDSQSLGSDSAVFVLLPFV